MQGLWRSEILVLVIFGSIGLSDSQDKCVLPSERRHLRSARALTIGKGLTWRGDSSSIPVEVINAEKRLNRLKTTIARQVKNAMRRANRYCSKNGKTFTSTFPGFTIPNFKQTTLCEGSWDSLTFPVSYPDDKTGWTCWTLQNFAQLKCPTYNCLSGECNIDKAAVTPSPNGPRVEHFCQISNFVDIPFYVYCFPENGAGFEFKRQVMTVSRCCSCVKLECIV